MNRKRWIYKFLCMYRFVVYFNFKIVSAGRIYGHLYFFLYYLRLILLTLIYLLFCIRRNSYKLNMWVSYCYRVLYNYIKKFYFFWCKYYKYYVYDRRLNFYNIRHKALLVDWFFFSYLTKSCLFLLRVLYMFFFNREYEITLGYLIFPNFMHNLLRYFKCLANVWFRYFVLFVFGLFSLYHLESDCASEAMCVVIVYGFIIFDDFLFFKIDSQKLSYLCCILGIKR